jgi:hypothetical protein
MRAPLATMLAALFVAGTLGTAHAADEKTNAQQERMKECNAQAGQKKLEGDARKSFMSSCLKGEAAPMSQQDKMKARNKDASAKKLQGDERKAFMSQCLSGEKKS